jgi:hypothetical protein
MKRVRSSAAGVSLGLALVLTLSVSPVSALILISTHGNFGDFGSYDSDVQPGARCGYSAADQQGFAYLRWVKVFPVEAGPAPGLDRQKVTWRVLIQQASSVDGPWTTVARSNAQSRKVTQNQSAGYYKVKVAVTGKAGRYYRAVSVLKWWRHGAVDGSAKFANEYYSNKWTVGSPDYIAHIACDGRAD